MNIQPITSSALFAIQADNIPKASRSSVSELPHVNAGNAAFTGGDRAKNFVDQLAHSLGGLNEESMRGFASDLARKYN